MKKLACVIITAILLMIPLTVNAESNVDVSLVVDYEYDNETIKITGKFVDIKLEEGIILADYCINYDQNILKLVEHRTIFPKDWEQYVDNEMVEGLFYIGEDEKFHWSAFTIPLGIGCKEDNELGLYLEFKVLNQTDTTVELEYYNISTELIKDGEATIIKASGNTAKIDIDFDEPQSPEIEISDVTVPESESVYIPDESSDTVNTSSDANASISVQNPSGKVSMPDIENNVTSDTANGSDAGNSGWVVWLLCGIGAIAVIACVVLVVNIKRGKK